MIGGLFALVNKNGKTNQF